MVTNVIEAWTGEAAPRVTDSSCQRLMGGSMFLTRGTFRALPGKGPELWKLIEAETKVR